MELADAGDLAQDIAQRRGTYLDEGHLWSVLVQLTRGLGALHDLKIVHRDLKTANVFLFRDGKVKIGDLNVSEVAKRGAISSQAGTPFYASPEVWNEQLCDEKSDIWSLGCVVYETATLRPPFQAQSMELLRRKVTQGWYSPLPAHFSNDLQAAVAAMLQVDPAVRPSCDQILSWPSVHQRFAHNRTRVHESALLGTIYAQSFSQAAGRLPAPRYSDEPAEHLPRLPTVTTLIERQEVRRPSFQPRPRNVTPDFTVKPAGPDRSTTVVRDRSADPVRNKLISDCCDQIIGSYERSRVVFGLLRTPYQARRSPLS